MSLSTRAVQVEVPGGDDDDDNTTAPFQRLCQTIPHEVLHHLIDHLDAHSLLSLHIAASSGTKTQRSLLPVAQLSVHRQLWSARLQADFDAAFLARNMPEAQVTPKDAYLRHRDVWVAEADEQRRLDAAARRLRERQAAHAAKQGSYKPCSDLYFAVQETCLPCVFFPLVGAFTVMLVRRLYDGEDVTLAVWAPLLALVGLVSLAVCCSCYVAKIARPVPFRDDTFDNDNSFLHAVIDALSNRPATNTRTSCALLSFTGVQIVFLALRTTGEVAWPWPVVFLPYLAMMAIMVVFPFVFRFEHIVPVWVGWWIFLAPLLATMGTLMARLEGDDGLQMYEVLIPLWIFFAFTLSVALIVQISSKGADPLPFWCLVCLPWVVFTILLACFYDLGDSGGITYVTLFIPIYILLCAGTVGGCVLGDDAWADRFDHPTPAEVCIFKPLELLCLPVAYCVSAMRNCCA